MEKNQYLPHKVVMRLKRQKLQVEHDGIDIFVLILLTQYGEPPEPYI